MSVRSSGSEALVTGALDAGVSLITGVPGYPITGIMEIFQDSTVEARWSVNEKVALEAALGASACGRRALVTVKHVGMNVLADPLITSVTHTIGAGLVIVAGDDPGVMQSQNEQDSRYYGLLAEIPVFDPSTPQHAYSSIRQAFTLSEQASTPVIVRVTDRLNTSMGTVERTAEDTGVFPGFDRNTWSYTLKGKHQRFHSNSYPLMLHASINSQLNKLNQKGKRTGIISSGFLSVLVEEVISNRYADVSHLALNHINPLPISIIRQFIKNHSRVLIIEETEPVIEQQLTFAGVLGKHTGHCTYGRIDQDDIVQALEHIEIERIDPVYYPETHKSRGFSRTICADCPYQILYNALGQLKLPVAGDLGCSVRTAPPPMELVDLAYSLGSSIAVATGFKVKGIALIGDYGLVHTGLQGLIEAVHYQKDVLVVVLQNAVAALTGGQEVPDMTDVVKALVPDTTILEMEQLKEKELQSILSSRLEKRGISVILARARCMKY